jgi:hypothetical protein
MVLEGVLQEAWTFTAVITKGTVIAYRYEGAGAKGGSNLGRVDRYEATFAPVTHTLISVTSGGDRVTTNDLIPSSVEATWKL